jgi:son of sevenless-like protein
MAALTAGVNHPSIRRMKRTWDQVKVRSTTLLEDLEKTLDMGNGFQAYRTMMRGQSPPCVPFLGGYLQVLTSIRDGAEDTLDGGKMINFHKQQMMADIIQEITKFQTHAYNLSKLMPVRTFIDESLVALEHPPDFWELSIAREPRGRDKATDKLIRKSGFF